MPQYAMQLFIHKQCTYGSAISLAVNCGFTDVIDAESQNCPASHALLYNVINNVIVA